MPDGLFVMSFSIAFGFIAGTEADRANYDPYLFAVGASAMFALACVALVKPSWKLTSD